MRGKILVIEDEEKISGIVKSYLEREGYQVTIAPDGRSALAQIKQRFDLVILDLMLPDIDGEAICSSIRKISDMPIIMLTAKSSEDDRIKGLGIGADDYVIKPFSAKELVARVKAHLRRTVSAQKKARSFNHGLLKIDPLTRQVTSHGIQVALTSTEFSILLNLAEKPLMIFSRLQIVDIVQGFDFEGYDRVVDAHIKNIRQKIADNPRDPIFIKTIYGVGYQFIGIPDA